MNIRWLRIISRLALLFGMLGIWFLLPVSPDKSNAVGFPAQPLDKESLDFSSIDAGGSHTCALTTGGSAQCWGSNYYGQLGDGTNRNSSAPVDVSGLGHDVAIVTGGDSHTCALTSAGGIKCWGFNGSGQLGDGTTADSYLPRDVYGSGGGMAAVAAGGYHTCGLTDSGGVNCWGFNEYGQLGNDAVADSSIPVAVVGLGSGVIQVAPGWNHTCALTSSGGVKCWGGNAFGQLGNGTLVDSATPVGVEGLRSGVTAIAAGDNHTCALTSQGEVKCWGNNEYGQLGDGTMISHSVPMDVIGIYVPFPVIAAGDNHTCGITSDGGVKCWGLNNYSGQLGDGTDTNRNTPVDVAGLGSGMISVTAGVAHTCALTREGNAKCWGANGFGQLGVYSMVQRSIPVDVSELDGETRSVIAGRYHTCALTSASGVKCWGYNYSGQVGDSTTSWLRSTPVDVIGLSSGMSGVSVGGYHTCGLASSGRVKCWGNNHFGQLGDGTWTDSSIPVDLVGLDATVQALAAGGSHTCALTTLGAVKCWGGNDSGQLGNGTMADSNIPVDVVGLGSEMISLTVGVLHSCGLTSSGGIKCWGITMKVS